MPQNLNRPLVEQTFLNYALSVQTTPTPINAALSWTSYIRSFAVSVPAAAANPVYIGDATVTTASGFELSTGNHAFAIEQERQLYEAQFPLLDIATILGCQPAKPEKIPFEVFVMANWYLVAAAVTDVRILLFKAPFA